MTDRLALLLREGGSFPVLDRAYLKVTGADRVRYLNGQTSNDMKVLSERAATWALVLTAKGKLCSLILAWLEGDSVVIETDAACEEALLPRLERYAISDDVVFDPITPEAPIWHVFGPAATALEGRAVSRLGLPGVDILFKPETAPEISAEEADYLRIAHGVPRWGYELDENILPQEASLEHSAVDFHKGCYVGQEVVSRLKSVGRVNKIVTGFTGDSIPIGSELLNEAGKKVGRITSSSAHFGAPLALGYLATAEEGHLFSAQNESGACLGRLERCEFPLVSA